MARFRFERTVLNYLSLDKRAIRFPCFKVPIFIINHNTLFLWNSIHKKVLKKCHHINKIKSFNQRYILVLTFTSWIAYQSVESLIKNGFFIIIKLLAVSLYWYLCHPVYTWQRNSIAFRITCLKFVPFSFSNDSSADIRQWVFE